MFLIRSDTFLDILKTLAHFFRNLIGKAFLQFVGKHIVFLVFECPVNRVAILTVPMIMLAMFAIVDAIWIV